MRLAVASAHRTGTAGPEGLLNDYAGFVDTLARSEMTRHVRRRQAAVFVRRVGDLRGWMRRPTVERLALIRRLDVWPFLCWCFATGRVVPDVELIAVKGKGGHFSMWTDMHPDDVAELRSAAASFDWTPMWRDRIVANAYPLLGLTRGIGLRRITLADLDAVDAEIATSMLLAPINQDPPVLAQPRAARAVLPARDHRRRPRAPERAITHPDATRGRCAAATAA
jgi:hypothetical protein